MMWVIDCVGNPIKITLQTDDAPEFAQPIGEYPELEMFA